MVASKNKNINKKTKPVSFSVGVNKILDRDNFIKEVLGLGYKKVDSVFKAGDISTRGDIVDVFPVYEKEPIRISFNFNNVESMSLFNIDSQRTVKIIESYDFWDVFGREVAQGRSLDGFITWDAIIKIKKKDGLYSILQSDQGELISAKTTPLKIKIQFSIGIQNE